MANKPISFDPNADFEVEDEPSFDPSASFEVEEIPGKMSYNPAMPTGPVGKRFDKPVDNRSIGEIFQDRVDEGGGWGISDETAKTLGYDGPVKALRPITNLPAAALDAAARGVQLGWYGLETLGDVANNLADKTGLTDALSVNGEAFQPGSVLPALGEAFPLGGAEAGLIPSVRHLDKAKEAQYVDILNNGTIEDAKQFARENKIEFKEGTLEPFFEARDAGKKVNPAVIYEPKVDAEGHAVFDPEAPFTVDEQPIADKLKAEADAFQPSKEPTPEDLFTPGKGLEERLQEEAAAFTQKKAEAPAEQAPSAAAFDIDRKAAEVKKDWTNAPEHVVFSSLDDIKDPAIREAADRQGAMDRPAFYGPDGRIYLNARELTPDEVPAAVFHESLGHYGLAQKFRGELNSVLRSMYDTNLGDYRLKADQYIKEHADEGRAVSPELAMEEVLAQESEKGVINKTVYDRLANLVKRKAREMGLKFRYSDREIKSILADAHRQVTHGERVDVSPDGIKTMYIGRNAKTFPQDSASDFLDEVETAHRLGADVDPAELREKYGVHRGPEGGMRTEISDENARIRPEIDWETVPPGERLPLSEVLDHPELFKAYPELRDVTVTRQPAFGDFFQGVQGWFDGKTLNITPYAKDPLSTSLHEIQHWIQEKEGWLSGGNSDTVLKSVTPNQLMRLYTEAEGKLKKDVAEYEGRYKAFEKAVNNPEVKSILDDLTETNAEWHRLRALRDKDPEVRTLHVYDKVKELEGNLREKLFGERSYLKLTYDQQLQYIDLVGTIREEGSAVKTLDELKKPYDKAVKSLEDLHNADDVTALGKAVPSDLLHKAYQNIFGEIEARDVQARKDLTPDQRRAVLPYSIANDVEVGDIVKAKGLRGEAASAEPVKFMEKRKREDYVKAGVNTRRIATMNDVSEVLSEYEKTYVPTKKETFAETKRKAREYLLNPNLIAKGLGVQNLAAKVHAYEQIHAQIMDDVAGLRKEVKEKGASPDLRQAMIEKSITLSAVRAGLLKDKAEIARATSAMRILKTTEGKADEFLRLISQQRGGVSDLADPGVFMKFMEQIDELLDAGDTKRAGVRLAKPRTLTDKIVGVAVDAFNLPRTVMATMDFSAPFRQGFFMIGSRNFYRALGPMFKYFASEKSYGELMSSIQKSPTYPLMKKSGLAISTIGRDLATREEAFISRWAEKIPGVRMSERAYSGFLNKLRADTFNQLVIRSRDAGIDLETDSKALKDIASFVNAATGRGNLGKLSSSGPLLTTMFFSPRLIASRVQMLNPFSYLNYSPVVRKEAIKALVSSGAIALTVAGLMKMAGAEVETDPRSSDFMKVKTGDTRYDILGGNGPYVVLGARLITNQTKTLKGDMKELGTDFPFDTRLDITGKFMTNKFSPAASFVADYLRGEDAVGNEFDLKSEAATRFIPLVLQDFASVMKEYGTGEGALRASPSIFGVGVQNFDPNSRMLDYKPPTSTFKFEGESVKLSGDKYEKYKEITKKLYEEQLKALTSSPRWAEADEETKRAAIKALNKEVRQQAREELIASGVIGSENKQ